MEVNMQELKHNFLVKNSEGAIYFVCAATLEENDGGGMLSRLRIRFGAAFCNPVDFPQNRNGFSKKQFREKGHMIAEGRFNSNYYWEIDPVVGDVTLTPRLIERHIKRWIIHVVGYDLRAIDRGRVGLLTDVKELPVSGFWTIGDPERVGLPSYEGHPSAFSNWISRFARVLVDEILSQRKHAEDDCSKNSVRTANLQM